MKKKIILLLSALLSISTVACGLDIATSSESSVTESVASETEAAKKVADKDNTKEENDIKQNKEEDKDNDSTGNEVTTEISPQRETESVVDSESPQEQSVEEVESEADNQTTPDPIALAEKYYEDSCAMYSKVLLSCPFILDYDNISDDGWAPVNDPACQNGIKDIENYYCRVFAEPGRQLYERYKEIDGKLYCNDAARGTNIFYDYTSFELVSEDENMLTFNAISTYTDFETGEFMESETAVFSIIKINDEYKVSEFEFPM